MPICDYYPHFKYKMKSTYFYNFTFEDKGLLKPLEVKSGEVIL